MGKNKKRLKYHPIDSVDLLDNRPKSDVVKTTNNENSKTDTKNDQPEDKNQHQESLIEGSKCEIDNETDKTNSNEKVDTKNSTSLKQQSNKKPQNIKEKSPNNEKVHKLDRMSTSVKEFTFNRERNVSSKDSFGSKEIEQKKEVEDNTDVVLQEINEDLFNLPYDYALAHCVAEDLKMGAGIAVDFKRKFGGVGKLIDQNLKIGDVGEINRHNRYVFYLITKRVSSGKPTMQTLEKALCSLHAKMKDKKLTKLGIPTIGCGLDRLDWDCVKSLINSIFTGSGIKISVCIPKKILESKAPSKAVTVKMSQTNLWDMEPQTDIIIFININKIKAKHWTDDIVEKLNVKYPFKNKLLQDVVNKTIDPGDIKHYNINGENIYCAFVGPSMYSSIEDAFIQISKLIRKSYTYLAIQSDSIQNDVNFKHIERIVLILRSIMNSKFCELWLCGADVDLLYDMYCRSIPYNSNYNSRNNSSHIQTGDKHNHSSDYYSKQVIPTTKI